MNQDCFVFRCPICGSVVEYGCAECPECGTVIDWSDLSSDNPNHDNGEYDECEESYEGYEDYKNPYDDDDNDDDEFDDGFGNPGYYDGYDEEEYNPIVRNEYNQPNIGLAQYPQGGFTCPCCGAQLLEGSKFCSYCGEAIDKDDWVLGGQFDIPVQDIEVELIKPRCPHCDCEIEFGCTQCPSCGTEIEWENRSDNLITFNPTDAVVSSKIHVHEKYVVEYPMPTVRFDTFNCRLSNKGRHLKVKDRYPAPTVVFSTL